MLYKKKTPTSASEAFLAGLNAENGSIENPFVTEEEISNLTSSSANQRTGAVIAFDQEAVYGTISLPVTGNVTFNSIGAKLSMTQLLIHNNSIAPTFGSQFKLINGAYSAGTLNYIIMTYINSTKIIYSIAQEI